MQLKDCFLRGKSWLNTRNSDEETRGSLRKVLGVLHDNRLTRRATISLPCKPFYPENERKSLVGLTLVHRHE
jgi:hypothetical protein